MREADALAFALVEGAGDGVHWDSTLVESRGDGRYRGVIDPVWCLLPHPLGGVVAGLAARAMEAELGSDVAHTLRSIHGVFAAPVAEGSVEVDVAVLRRGRSMSHLQATVRNVGSRAGFTALAVFGGSRRGPDFTQLAFPAVPPPEECRSHREPFPDHVEGDRWPMRFWEEVADARLAIGLEFWEEGPRDQAEAANWLRLDQDLPVDGDGFVDPIAAIVLSDIMPSSIFQRIDPAEGRWFTPSVDLTIHPVGPATPGWLLAHYKTHIAHDGYASIEGSLWDPRGESGPTLVAWATQQAFFTEVSASSGREGGAAGAAPLIG